MNKALDDYHEQRRPFIILPKVGIIIGEKGMSYSHRDILANLGFNPEQIFSTLEAYPRGYFLNNKLVIYQSDDVKEGEYWVLKEENYPLVRQYFDDLKNLFHLSPDTKIFLGILRGKEGELWPTVNEVDFDFFE